jgi:hypothetical protein
VARSLAVALVGGVCLAGCSDAVLPLVTAWLAELRQVSPAHRVSGQVGVLSQPGRSETTIQITGADEGVTYAWRILTGTCASKGDVVGGRASYPRLQIGADGAASGETTLSRELNPEGQFAAWLFRLAVGGAETDAACGVLRRSR